VRHALHGGSIGDTRKKHPVLGPVSAAYSGRKTAQTGDHSRDAQNIVTLNAMKRDKAALRKINTVALGGERSEGQSP